MSDNPAETNPSELTGHAFIEITPPKEADQEKD